jgi:hypothetical protein
MQKKRKNLGGFKNFTFVKMREKETMVTLHEFWCDAWVSFSHIYEFFVKRNLGKFWEIKLKKKSKINWKL